MCLGYFWIDKVLRDVGFYHLNKTKANNPNNATIIIKRLFAVQNAVIPSLIILNGASG